MALPNFVLKLCGWVGVRVVCCLFMVSNPFACLSLLQDWSQTKRQKYDCRSVKSRQQKCHNVLDYQMHCTTTPTTADNRQHKPSLTEQTFAAARIHGWVLLWREWGKKLLENRMVLGPNWIDGCEWAHDISDSIYSSPNFNGSSWKSWFLSTQLKCVIASKVKLPRGWHWWTRQSLPSTLRKSKARHHHQKARNYRCRTRLT